MKSGIKLKQNKPLVNEDIPNILPPPPLHIIPPNKTPSNPLFNSISLIQTKIKYIQEIIRNTIISVQNNKMNNIFSNSDVNICITTLNQLYEKTIEIYKKTGEHKITPLINTAILNYEIATLKLDPIISLIQSIIDKLSIIICGFGTKNIDDLLFICFGTEYKNKIYENELLNEKMLLIKQFTHPIGYKIIHWKANKSPLLPHSNISIKLCDNKNVDNPKSIETSDHLECFEMSNCSFYKKIHGIQFAIHNEIVKKTIVVQCLIDDIDLDCFTNKYIDERKKSVLYNIPQNNKLYDSELINRILETMTLRDILIFGDLDVYKHQLKIMADVNFIKTTKFDNVISTFLRMDTILQRNMLINLLIYNKEDEIQYITYLLYDLITINNANGLGGNDGTTSTTINSVDSPEQMMIYNSFSWKIKSYFKDAMNLTMRYSKDISTKYDTNRITLEQKVYMMKVPENVKEKAMVKLKEIKGKNDESGVKSKQYLEGLLRIPFGIIKKEPILSTLKDININYGEFNKEYGNKKDIENIKDTYSTIEILKNIKQIRTTLFNNTKTFIIDNINTATIKQVASIIALIQSIYKSQNNITVLNELCKCKTKNERVEYILLYLETIQSNNLIHIQIQICEILNNSKSGSSTDIMNNSVSLSNFNNKYDNINKNIAKIEPMLSEITQSLDNSIYGHSYAKDQLLKIIGQWISGEQTGYCFGFEGSPGVGKTSLAKKGLSGCLKDAEGVSRPFAFIALGGSCNGSVLEGHSYTYVNSLWGKIVDILMETKCMNPIIYIDELDKVSKTEQGKEIIGILTHLIDPTQNDVFQDKYFSGIDIDLSKVLFIFSYNDPSQIDHVLLDRIHRVKFDNLSIDEKIVIVDKYILPEINKKMGFSDIVVLSKELIEHIIEVYTFEPGVRKLKELLFDLYGCINIELLKCKSADDITLPLHITVDDLETKYLTKYNKSDEQKIHKTNMVGIINGLWANAMGKGGIITIETMLYPANDFLHLLLTGCQGDVMKESMNVAKNLAWNLTPQSQREIIIKRFQETKIQGLHIHCPEGAVSKDGPSAGTAITIAIYSILNDKPIKNTVAITGEINLQGYVTAIGGLDLKILGGIRAGVLKFLFPAANTKDFEKFMKKYKDKKEIENIEFIKVSTIMDVFPHIFEE